MEAAIFIKEGLGIDIRCKRRIVNLGIWPPRVIRYGVGDVVGKLGIVVERSVDIADVTGVDIEIGVARILLRVPTVVP